MPETPAGPQAVTIVANDIAEEGGMELQLTELIGGLLKAGHHVTVISWTCSLPLHPNLRWIRVPGPSRPFSIGYPWFLILASLLVRLRGRGLIHSTGAIVLNSTDVCTVHFCHHAVAELPGFSRSSRSGIAHRVNARVVKAMSRAAERWCYRPGRTRRLVAVSAGLERELNRHFPRMRARTTVVPNGVDTEAFRPAPGPAKKAADGRLNAIFVGSEWERKGLRPAIEALAICPEVELTVVGGGDSAAYGRLAAVLGVADRVRFAGTTTDPASWYRRGDVLVLPTAYESFSLVTYEAAASGLPLLVTRVNGVEDLLEDGENGWFIDRDAGRIGDRLRELHDEPERRRRMGAAARAASLRFSWSRVVDRYRDLYAAAAGS